LSISVRRSGGNIPDPAQCLVAAQNRRDIEDRRRDIGAAERGADRDVWR